MTERMKKTICGCFEGEATLTRTTIWLAGALIFTLGVIYGLCMAPMTHGVRIGCDNVSQNDCTFGDGSVVKDEEEEE